MVRARRIVATVTDEEFVSFPDSAEFIFEVRCSSLQLVMLARWEELIQFTLNMYNFMSKKLKH